MVSKHIELPERCVQIIEDVQKTNGFKTQTQALIHMIDAYQFEQEKKEMKTEIYKELNQELREIFAGLVASGRKTEQSVNVLLDVANSTLLQKGELKFIPTSVVKSDFVKKSEELQKQKLSELARKKRRLNLKQK